MNEEDIKIILEEFQRLENVSTAIESNMLLKRKHLENELLKKQSQQLKENNLAMQEEMARTWAKLDKKEDIINKIKEYVNENTIDEAPFVYKPMQEIIDCIGDSVEIEKIIKPIYNFKANE